MNVGAWIRASRLPSQSYIALPLLLGQLTAWRATGEWSWGIFALVQAFGIFDQLYIVYANDYADQDTDQLNETNTIFSGGSRVLVDGEISPESLLRAAALMAVLAVGTGIALLIGWGRVLSVPLMVTGILLLWAYSYGPLRMSYRGGGEILQMLGVGLILPLIGFEAQAGTLVGFPWEMLAFLLPMNLATGLCTALPDEPSDRASQKRTFAVVAGGATARGVIVGLNVVGLLAFTLVGASQIVGLEWSVETFVIVPVIALFGQLAVMPRATPGSVSMLVFVFFGLLCNLSLVAGLLLDLAIF